MFLSHSAGEPDFHVREYGLRAVTSLMHTGITALCRLSELRRPLVYVACFMNITSLNISVEGNFEIIQAGIVVPQSENVCNQSMPHRTRSDAAAYSGVLLTEYLLAIADRNGAWTFCQKPLKPLFAAPSRKSSRTRSCTNVEVPLRGSLIRAGSLLISAMDCCSASVK